MIDVISQDTENHCYFEIAFKAYFQANFKHEFNEDDKPLSS